MKKAVWWIIGLLVLVLIAMVIFGGSAEAPQDVPDDIAGEEVELAGVFKEELNTKGVADIGMPIEGFDAGLLMMAYPQLVVADFQGVETLEGHYEVVDGEVTFVRDVEEPITSAERAVSDEGYATLLANVTARLNVEVVTAEDVEALVIALDEGEEESL